MNTHPVLRLPINVGFITEPPRCMNWVWCRDPELPSRRRRSPSLEEQGAEMYTVTMSPLLLWGKGCSGGTCRNLEGAQIRLAKPGVQGQISEVSQGFALLPGRLLRRSS